MSTLCQAKSSPRLWAQCLRPAVLPQRGTIPKFSLPNIIFLHPLTVLVVSLHIRLHPIPSRSTESSYHLPQHHRSRLRLLRHRRVSPGGDRQRMRDLALAGNRMMQPGLRPPASSGKPAATASPLPPLAPHPTKPSRPVCRQRHARPTQLSRLRCAHSPLRRRRHTSTFMSSRSHPSPSSRPIRSPRRRCSGRTAIAAGRPLCTSPGSLRTPAGHSCRAGRGRLRRRRVVVGSHSRVVRRRRR